MTDDIVARLGRTESMQEADMRALCDEAAAEIVRLRANLKSRMPYPLTHHSTRSKERVGQLHVVPDADNWWSIHYVVDGSYADRDTADAVLADVWRPALGDAVRILNNAQQEAHRG